MNTNNQQNTTSYKHEYEKNVLVDTPCPQQSPLPHTDQSAAICLKPHHAPSSVTPSSSPQSPLSNIPIEDTTQVPNMELSPSITSTGHKYCQHNKIDENLEKIEEKMEEPNTQPKKGISQQKEVDLHENTTVNNDSKVGKYLDNIIIEEPSIFGRCDSNAKVDNSNKQDEQSDDNIEEAIDDEVDELSSVGSRFEKLVLGRTDSGSTTTSTDTASTVILNPRYVPSILQQTDEELTESEQEFIEGNNTNDKMIYF